MKKTRNISRHPGGLQVRILRAGELYTKWFAKLQYRTWRATFKAAEEWRDAQLKQLPEPTRDDRRSRGRVWCEGDYWHGWVRSADGRRRATSRSIALHGSRRAKRLVREWLAAHLAERDALEA